MPTKCFSCVSKRRDDHRFVDRQEQPVNFGRVVSVREENIVIQRDDGRKLEVPSPTPAPTLFSEVIFREVEGRVQIHHVQPYHPQEKRYREYDVVHRLSPDSVEQVASIFNLNADYHSPISPLGHAVDARNMTKTCKSMLECEEEVILQSHLRNRTAPEDKKQLLCDEDLQAALAQGLSPLFVTTRESAGAQILQYHLCPGDGFSCTQFLTIRLLKTC
jgi:hypothetical protein